MSNGFPSTGIFRLVKMAGRFGLVAGICLTVLLSLTPSGALPGLGLWDKLAHLVAYGLMALAGGIGFPSRPTLIRLFVSLILLGVVLELGQGWTGHRSAEVADAVANTVGVLAGLSLAIIYRRWVTNRFGSASSMAEMRRP